ncbi:hypothetical protein MMC17_002067 [Xylographa soralifera]|nr:hypothetical protein [Xylographa soralifera]
MASSRFMRNSPRTASPLDIAPNNSSTPENELEMQQETLDLPSEWKEPPLRTPAPSFEDYKGLERHGVLEHMAPLGAMPNQKVRLRIKQHEPSRRSTLGKTIEAAAGSKEPSKAPEVLGGRRRSESRKVEERPSKAQIQREKDEDQDYTPKSIATKSATAKAASSRNTHAPVPSSQTTAGQERLRQVVVSAVERAKELGNEHLGLAMQRIYEESLQNRTLAELLDAVLSQRPTPRQAADFQAYIKIARKKIKSENSRSRRSSMVGIGSSSKSTSKSPSKSVGPTGARKVETPLDSMETEATTNPNQRLHSPSPKLRSTDMPGAHDEPRIKRIKRSKSVSSTSSLSSLSSTDPAIDLDHDHNNDQPSSSPIPLHSKMARIEARASNGPKMHTFATGRTPSTRRQSAPAVKVQPVDSSLPEDELTTKRKQLTSVFPDYKVEESNLRTEVAPELWTGSCNGPALLSLQFSSTRRDDFDDTHSPVSSTQGDFLVPPPPGAQRLSRGATPNQILTRPRKELRKGARIKNSPLKKKSGVVAGIAQKSGGRDSPVGYGHAGDNGEVDNNDYCNACGGSGQLLCCDGCTRSFHFKCLDPPMNPRNPPEGEWYCHVCVAERVPPTRRPRGIFSSLMGNIENHNPIAFNLPLDVRHAYEGVKTGEDGEYVDTTIYRAKPREDGAVTHELQDKKGNLIICCRCEKSALGHRTILQCDYCNKQYHLDCLDPPMANPPSKLCNWKCPAHFDEELLSFKYPGGDRIIKVRRPKHPRIIDTALRRGHKNNGLIEIENDITDEEEEQPQPHTVPRISELQIKLDFIDRAKRAREQCAAYDRLNERFSLYATEKFPETTIAHSIESADPPVSLNAVATEKTFSVLAVGEQDAVLSLLNLSTPVSHPRAARLQSIGTPAVPVQNLQNLVTTLMAEAPPEVLNMVRKDEAKVSKETKATNAKVPRVSHTSPRRSTSQSNKVNTGEVQQLLMLQELIRLRLEGFGAAK